MLAPQLVQQLDQALTGLAFGSVQLIIHDSQLVRIERVERVRLTVTPEAECSSTPGDVPTGSPEVSRANDGGRTG